ncbi:MAG: enoyl-CoA hydratase-related protein, partial [Mycobacteriales bacterium]
LAERHGPVLLLTLNRPERRNAWTILMQDRYLRALAAADADPDIRAVVVTGAGRAFCAGADMALLSDTRAAVREALAQTDPLPATLPFTLRIPLVAAIHGACVGVGFAQALFADVRFAALDAGLATVFARRGLVAEYATAWLLPRLVGLSRAHDLLLSGRTVSGEEAAAIGLVHRALPAAEVLPAALAYAADLAESCSPRSIATMKAQLRRALTSDFASAAGESEDLMVESFGWPDLAEGVGSWMDKRPPRFPPLAPESAEVPGVAG